MKFCLHGGQVQDGIQSMNMRAFLKIMGPFWLLVILRHLIFRVPKRDPKFGNYSCAQNMNLSNTGSLPHIAGYNRQSQGKAPNFLKAPEP